MFSRFWAVETIRGSCKQGGKQGRATVVKEEEDETLLQREERCMQAEE